jgi:hypothetical protein
VHARPSGKGGLMKAKPLEVGKVKRVRRGEKSNCVLLHAHTIFNFDTCFGRAAFGEMLR